MWFRLQFNVNFGVIDVGVTLDETAASQYVLGETIFKYKK